MGVDCRIMLPGNVRIRDVMSVIGVAVGFQPTRRSLGKTGYCTDVKGVSAEQPVGNMPDFFYIKFDGRHAYWSYEPENNVGGRMIMPKSTAFWCLVGQRLVDFFGGKVDYNDCDDVEFDYVKRNRGDARNAPTSDEPWMALQDRIAAVKPITREELENFTGAAYCDDDYEYNFDDAGNMVRGDWNVKLEEAA